MLEFELVRIYLLAKVQVESNLSKLFLEMVVVAIREMLPSQIMSHHWIPENPITIFLCYRIVDFGSSNAHIINAKAKTVTNLMITNAPVGVSKGEILITYNI